MDPTPFKSRNHRNHWTKTCGIETSSRRQSGERKTIDASEMAIIIRGGNTNAPN
jgi:hypothetical protein